MMAPKKTDASSKKVMNKGAWTTEEDAKLSEYVEIHGPKRWKTIATKSGLNRCGKSCRLRWLNYLRPNIKRGNISDDEEDLILRLHKLLGNRWSLIAGRLPGRTDNEIKNYWNSHLSKKISEEKDQKITQEPTPLTSPAQESPSPLEPLEAIAARSMEEEEAQSNIGNKAALANLDVNFDVNELFDFSTEGSFGMEWVNKFLELDEDSWLSDNKKYEDIM